MHGLAACSSQCSGAVAWGTLCSMFVELHSHFFFACWLALCHPCHRCPPLLSHAVLCHAVHLLNHRETLSPLLREA